MVRRSPSISARQNGNILLAARRFRGEARLEADLYLVSSIFASVNDVKKDSDI